MKPLRIRLQALNDPRVKRILRYTLYPAFYLFALLVFLFWTFPYDRLKERVVLEFNAKQPAGPGVRMEIDEMSSYWGSGLEAEGVRLISPPSAAEEDGKPAKEKVVDIQQLHARISLLRWIFGKTHVNFGADAFGGELSGYSSSGGEVDEFHLELEDVDAGELPMLEEAVELPLGGQLNGAMTFNLAEGKLAKADGTLELRGSDLSVGDGKAKIKGAIALPRVDAGELEVKAEATEGRLKIETFTLKGKDLELVAEGQVRLRDPANTSLLEMTVRFKFSDQYRNKNDTTRSLLGSPGSTMPALFDLDPKVKRAKRADGFYAWRVSGTLAKPIFSPAPQGSEGTSGRSRGLSGRGSDPGAPGDSP